MRSSVPVWKVALVLVALAAGLVVLRWNEAPPTSEVPPLDPGTAPEPVEAEEMTIRAPEPVEPAEATPSPDEVVLQSASPAVAAGGSSFSPGKVSFSVQFKDEVSPYFVMSAFVMPGEEMPVAVVDAGTGAYAIDAAAGAVEPTSATAWRWKAPQEKGLYPLRITELASGASVTLNAFVLVPFDHRSTSLNGYRIGQYQAQPLRGDPLYNRPPGFVEVTPENLDVPVAPHFTLGQFLCKQADGYPKYLILRERLLQKLERILEAVNRMGTPANTLYVMSAFRTPFYNASIGNKTIYSRHLFGGAADVYVDADEDGYMDDLNGDGKVTTEDAAALAAVVEAQTEKDEAEPYYGGLGIYDANPNHGPFVHVDVRGRNARW